MSDDLDAAAKALASWITNEGPIDEEIANAIATALRAQRRQAFEAAAVYADSLPVESGEKRRVAATIADWCRQQALTELSTKEAP